LIPVCSPRISFNLSEPAWYKVFELITVTGIAMFPINLGVRVAVTTTSSIAFAVAESIDICPKATLEIESTSNWIKNFIYWRFDCKNVPSPWEFYHGIVRKRENGYL